MARCFGKDPIKAQVAAVHLWAGCWESANENLVKVNRRVTELFVTLRLKHELKIVIVCVSILRSCEIYLAFQELHG